MNESGSVTAGDALLVLKDAVGQQVALKCQSIADLASCRAATCGNGLAEYGEVCDGSDLHGRTCSTEDASKPYGTLACGDACAAFDTSGCRARFTDNGDGTVTDNATNLMWEKKTTAVASGADAANPHDVDNTYTWAASASAPNGTVFTDFLDKLNGQAGGNTGFAAFYDWRLPTVEELLGLVDSGASGCGTGGPCIDAVFGPTVASYYWTTTGFADYPLTAWCVYFGDGMGYNNTKTDAYSVRAVRNIN